MAATVGEREPIGLRWNGVRVLEPADVDRLRLGWHHRHDQQEVRRLLEIFPGRSVWIPDTREFALVGPWRNRDEIVVVQELSAIRGIDSLVACLIELSRDAGTALVLITELDERRRPSFYERLGFQGLEEVITYELDRPDARPLTVQGLRPVPLTFVPVAAHDHRNLATVLRVDHVAFPWIWWNSATELQAYAMTPGVALYLGLLDGEPVGYIGVTSYPGWGHLDRIAVLPEFQGRGLGRRILGFATATLARRGARRIGLSTQVDNVRSQRLYERFGFRRSRVNDYRLYGAWLRTPIE
jgi:ribosomal protein S18 acetylase RimI-like enzyme